jgi:hypothetical protein
METLNEFLLDRILEDESLANAAIDAHEMNHVWGVDLTAGSDGSHIARWDPWRVLTTCIGMRLLVAAHRDVGAGVDRRADPDRTVTTHACSTCGQYDEYAVEWPCYTLRVLALGWVGHPAYRQEWRPRRLSSGVSRAPAAVSLPAATDAEQQLDSAPTANPGPAASGSNAPVGLHVSSVQTRSGVA